MSVAREVYALFVGGEWRQALSGGTFGVTNPATGETVATLPDGGAPDMQSAIEAAARAQRGWGRTTAGERAGQSAVASQIGTGPASSTATIMSATAVTNTTRPL